MTHALLRNKRFSHKCPAIFLSDRATLSPAKIKKAQQDSIYFSKQIGTAVAQSDFA